MIYTESDIKHTVSTYIFKIYNKKVLSKLLNHLLSTYDYSKDIEFFENIMSLTDIAAQRQLLNDSKYNTVTCEYTKNKAFIYGNSKKFNCRCTNYTDILTHNEEHYLSIPEHIKQKINNCYIFDSGAIKALFKFELAKIFKTDNFSHIFNSLRVYKCTHKKTITSINFYKEFDCIKAWIGDLIKQFNQTKDDIKLSLKASIAYKNLYKQSKNRYTSVKEIIIKKLKDIKSYNKTYNKSLIHLYNENNTILNELTTINTNLVCGSSEWWAELSK